MQEQLRLAIIILNVLYIAVWDFPEVDGAMH
jgi:hypothetical protein